MHGTKWGQMVDWSSSIVSHRLGFSFKGDRVYLEILERTRDEM